MRYQSAFTLIEMLIVVALLSILGLVAVPALVDFIEANRQQALYHQVIRAVHHARSHAVTQRVAVELCGTQDGISCHTDWSRGWLLMDAQAKEPLAVTLLKNDRPRLQWRGFRNKIQFHSNGISPTGNGRFYSCYKQQMSWQLVLNRQGRLRKASSAENAAEQARCQ